MKKYKRSVLKRFTVVLLVLVLMMTAGCGKKEKNAAAANAANGTAAADQTSERAAETTASATEQPEVQIPDVTAVFYGAGAHDLQWDLADSVLRAMLGLYQTSGINYVAVLGGSNHWPEGYLAGLLDTKDGEAVNRTGWFCVNVDAVNKKLDSIAEEYGMDPWDLIDTVTGADEDDLRDELLERLNEEMLCESTLPQIEGTEITLDYPIQEECTLERALNIVTNQFPADNYFLTMSGHGGGSMGGVCYSEKCQEGKDNMLTIPAMDEAFSRAGFGDDMRLGLLTFDACSMGGIELGARLSRYFDFMIGSQQGQVGGLDQYILIRSIVNNRTETDFTYIVAQDVNFKKYDNSKGITDMQTGAVFFGPGGQGALDAMDAAAAELLKAARRDGKSEAEIYDAIKRAMMFCRYTEAYPDGRDFFTGLQKAFHEKNMTQFDEVIQGAISEINYFMVENWYSLDNLSLYNSLEGGIIKENAEFRKKYIDHDLCGGSVCVIDSSKYNEAYSSDSIEQFNECVSDIISEFDKNYTDRYKDCGLKNYAALMKQCAEYYLREDQYAGNKKLAADLADPAGADYKEITDVHWSDDQKAVQVEIVDYQDEKAEASSGDALEDFLDTSASFKLYLTRRLPVEKKSNGKQIELDYIIGSKAGGRENMEAAHKELNFRVSEWMTVPVCYVSSPSAKADTLLDIVTPSEVYDADFWRKVDVLMNALTVEEDAAVSVVDQYRVYEGGCRTKGKVSDKKALHVFKKDGDNYQYKCTLLVKGDWDSGEFIHVDAPEAIRFDHYYMGDVISSESGKDTGTDAYRRLEKDYSSVYDSDQYWYSSDVLNQLWINKTEASAIDKNPQKYGYYIGVAPTSASNSMVLFNKNDAAVKGNSYAQLPAYGDIQ